MGVGGRQCGLKEAVPKRQWLGNRASPINSTTMLLSIASTSCWPGGKGVRSGVRFPRAAVGIFPGGVIQVTQKMYLQRLPCQSHQLNHDAPQCHVTSWWAGGKGVRHQNGTPGFDSYLHRGSLSGSSHTGDFKISTPVARLPAVRRYKVIIGSALGMVGPVLVYCDRVRQNFNQ